MAKRARKSTMNLKLWGASLPATVFCDDIRFETSGKRTLIGVYRNEIIVPQLPFLLGQLSCLTRFSAEPGASFNLSEWRLSIPGAEERVEPANLSYVSANSDPGETLTTVEFSKAFSSLNFTQGGWIVLRANINSNLLEVGRIRILDSATYGEQLSSHSIHQVALSLALGYVSSIVPVLESKLGAPAVHAGVTRLVQSLAQGKISFQLNDPDQPIWLRLAPKQIWVLYTQPFHSLDSMLMYNREVAVKFKVVESTAIGFIAQLDKSAPPIDDQLQVTFHRAKMKESRPSKLRGRRLTMASR